MLNLYNWGKNHWQVTLEGASFYFDYKVPIAFRPVDKKDLRIFIPNIKFGRQSREFVDMLYRVGKVVAVPADKFRPMVEKEYKKAIMAGAQKIARDRLLSESETEKENAQMVCDS